MPTLDVPQIYLITYNQNTHNDKKMGKIKRKRISRVNSRKLLIQQLLAGGKKSLFISFVKLRICNTLCSLIFLDNARKTFAISTHYYIIDN